MSLPWVGNFHTVVRSKMKSFRHANEDNMRAKLEAIEAELKAEEQRVRFLNEYKFFILDVI